MTLPLEEWERMRDWLQGFTQIEAYHDSRHPGRFAFRVEGDAPGESRGYHFAIREEEVFGYPGGWREFLILKGKEVLRAFRDAGWTPPEPPAPTEASWTEPTSFRDEYASRSVSIISLDSYIGCFEYVRPSGIQHPRRQERGALSANVVQSWCEENGYTEPEIVDGRLWAFPPNGVMPVPISLPAMVDARRQNPSGEPVQRRRSSLRGISRSMLEVRDRCDPVLTIPEIRERLGLSPSRVDFLTPEANPRGSGRTTEMLLDAVMEAQVSPVVVVGHSLRYTRDLQHRAAEMCEVIGCPVERIVFVDYFATNREEARRIRGECVSVNVEVFFDHHVFELS
jgi:hypothetical protein